MPLLFTWEWQMALFVVAERMFNLVSKLWCKLQLALHENFRNSSLSLIRGLTRSFLPLGSSLITFNLIVPNDHISGKFRRIRKEVNLHIILILFQNLREKAEESHKKYQPLYSWPVFRPKFEPSTSWIRLLIISTTCSHNSAVSSVYRLSILQFIVGADFARSKDFA
jgi:hypothetical protein